jgi:hypothetical protein
VRGGDDGFGFLDRRGDRLLDIDVHAALQGAHRQLGMGHCRRSHGQDVDLVDEGVPVLGVKALGPDLGGQLQRAAGAAVIDAHQLDALRLEIFARVVAAEYAGAGDAGPKSFGPEKLGHYGPWAALDSAHPEIAREPAARGPETQADERSRSVAVCCAHRHKNPDSPSARGALQRPAFPS